MNGPGLQNIKYILYSQNLINYIYTKGYTNNFEQNLICVKYNVKHNMYPHTYTLRQTYTCTHCYKRTHRLSRLMFSNMLAANSHWFRLHKYIKHGQFSKTLPHIYHDSIFLHTSPHFPCSKVAPVCYKEQPHFF